MKVFLRKLSDSDFQNSVGEELGVHHTTVCKTYTSVMDAVLEKANIFIKFSRSAEAVVEAKRLWSERYRFPNAVGVIDCTHVRIPKFQEFGDEYINRKRYPSINVQATCNAQDIFTGVDCQWPGSVHASRIFKNSDIYHILKNSTEKCVLLGDDGYSISPWVMTPWRTPATQEQQNYNNVFCWERVIERCFGQLKARFSVLQYKISNKLEKIPSTIIVCVVLHNIAKHLHVEDFHYSNQVDDFQINAQNNDLPKNMIRQLGQQKRELITQMLFN
ncbi:hypothetical protein MML48_4g00007084 [Holotrichia oblita]|uniref:Uncharacterized protein n=1 Tax=Holotrichia oblita TaxID=644536 RepID=A0ACB9T8Y3_HOLOL|nr:hypothetical protein MML48_4g00007084 [Holotrichia oblita]